MLRRWEGEREVSVQLEKDADLVILLLGRRVRRVQNKKPLMNLYGSVSDESTFPLLKEVTSEENFDGKEQYERRSASYCVLLHVLSVAYNYLHLLHSTYSSRGMGQEDLRDLED